MINGFYCYEKTKQNKSLSLETNIYCSSNIKGYMFPLVKLGLLGVQRLMINKYSILAWQENNRQAKSTSEFFACLVFSSHVKS